MMPPGLDYEVEDASDAAGVGLKDDSVPLYTPENSFAIGTQYEFQLGDLGTLTPRIDYTWRDKVHTDNHPDMPFSTEPSLGLLNAYLTYQSPSSDWTARLEATNLTDEEYYVSRVISVNPFGNSDGQPGRPREVFFSLRRDFR